MVLTHADRKWTSRPHVIGYRLSDDVRFLPLLGGGQVAKPFEQLVVELDRKGCHGISPGFSRDSGPKLRQSMSGD
jgi:hypothetical protein